MTKAEDPIGFLGRLLLALLVFHAGRKWFGWIVGIIAGFFAFTRGGEVVDFIKEKLTER
jgi:hypothetical protein